MQDPDFWGLDPHQGLKVRITQPLLYFFKSVSTNSANFMELQNLIS